MRSTALLQRIETHRALRIALIHSPGLDTPTLPTELDQRY